MIKIIKEKMKKEMVMVKNIMKMEKLNMKVILLMVNMKEMENIIMKMVNIIVDNLKMV